MKTILIVIFALTLPLYADCVQGATTKTRFQVINGNKILLTGGVGPDILIQVWGRVSRFSDIVVLKDYFCSYEEGVLLIDGKVVDVTTVKKVKKP